MKEPHTARHTSRHAPAGRTVCISVFLTELSFWWALPTTGGASTSPGLLLSFLGSFLGRSNQRPKPWLHGVRLWAQPVVYPGTADHRKGWEQLRGRGGLHSGTQLSAAWGQQMAADAWPLSEGMGCPHPDPVGAWMVPGSRAGL